MSEQRKFTPKAEALRACQQQSMGRLQGLTEGPFPVDRPALATSLERGEEGIKARAAIHRGPAVEQTDAGKALLEELRAQIAAEAENAS